MATDPSPHEAALRECLARRPGLRPLLERLCELWDREGVPPQRLSLQPGRDRHETLLDLHAAFGNAAIRSSRAGSPTALEVAAFLAGLGEGGSESWGLALHQVLGRPLRNRAAERREAAAACTALLAEWRQTYPTVAAAAAAIEARQAWWQQRLAETSPLAVAAQWDSWGRALTFLTPGKEPTALAELGARFYGSSKALRSGEARQLLLAGLAALDGAGSDDADPSELLRRYGVCDNPTALKVTVFGPLRLRKHGRWLDWPAALHALGEAATLSYGNLEGVDAIECSAAGSEAAHTCENETPFCRLVRERFPGLLVYTEGYPNSAVRRLLRLLPSGRPLRHWGDSDLDGLRIAAMLAEERHLELWRCGLQDLRRHRHLLQPLDQAQRQRAERWQGAHSDFRFRTELDFALAHGWLEQESWEEEWAGEASQA